MRERLGYTYLYHVYETRQTRHNHKHKVGNKQTNEKILITVVYITLQMADQNEYSIMEGRIIRKNHHLYGKTESYISQPCYLRHFLFTIAYMLTY